MPRDIDQRADGDFSPRAAETIHRAFTSYLSEFRTITRRAPARFDARDWHGVQADSVERLDLYPRSIHATDAILAARLSELPAPVESWKRAKAGFADLIAGREDFELAETFFNSVARRLFPSRFVDDGLGFLATDPVTLPKAPPKPPYATYSSDRPTLALVQELLASHRFSTAFQDLERDSELVAKSIDSHLGARLGADRIDAVEVIKPLFYRSKSAYLVGRIRCQHRIVPLVLPLLNTDDGIVVDAALLTEDDVSIVFSFTRSYFHVDVDTPRHLILFLKSIVPLKRIAELYISIGHNRHGKTELYRDLVLHLESSSDMFEIARGERGMVMIVFTLPSYDIVFKVIRDSFPYPKTTVRQQVIERYNLVFKHDRAGRLVDAQEFENWRFDRRRFSPALLKELTEQASDTVRVEGDEVMISHLYTERRLTPLDLYVKETDRRSAIEAVLDYGQTVKDLAATNIFPGDMLLKNFGVTRHGRVVFYDYDELCLLTDCNFRSIPAARNPGEELQAEPWYFVGENDVFPEEFINFLGIRGELRDLFLDSHGDLMQVGFWNRMQERHERGEIIDVFPYKQAQRFTAGAGPASDL